MTRQCARRLMKSGARGGALADGITKLRGTIAEYIAKSSPNVGRSHDRQVVDVVENARRGRGSATTAQRERIIAPRVL